VSVIVRVSVLSMRASMCQSVGVLCGRGCGFESVRVRERERISGCVCACV